MHLTSGQQSLITVTKFVAEIWVMAIAVTIISPLVILYLAVGIVIPKVGNYQLNVKQKTQQRMVRMGVKMMTGGIK
jgi:hypothetical protein